MPQTNKEWRENIHGNLKLIFPEEIPRVVINAIDAAYVAGLDETIATKLKEIEGEIEGMEVKIDHSNIKVSSVGYNQALEDISKIINRHLGE